MKLISTLLVSLYFSIQLVGQSAPGCQDLKVEAINISNPGELSITLSNNCSDCMSGIDGCVYMEMQVFRTVFPYDTLAQSDCWCLITPDNESSTTYTINTTLTTLPPVSDLRVSFPCGPDGCDDLPFSSSLAVDDNQKRTVKLYPNPARNIVTVESQYAFPFNVRLVNILGTELGKQKLTTSGDHIDLSKLPKGIYLVEISDANNRRVRTSKIVKE